MENMTTDFKTKNANRKLFTTSTHPAKIQARRERRRYEGAFGNLGIKGHDDHDQDAFDLMIIGTAYGRAK